LLHLDAKPLIAPMKGGVKHILAGVENDMGDIHILDK
jgi:hypothetical protein